ncbi:GrpB family protein [Hymenobacter sp. B81]|uniref:GrpB family protein n=1 Tax=Hymenobacter sp. B81 TaxID=3344878 RepID=UPI0037DDC262
MEPAKPILVTPYSDHWPIHFQQLQEVYASQVSGLVVGIEHVGSTSVPGLKAKPIIDIDVIVADETRLKAVIPRLADLGYRHVGDQGIRGREAFERTSPFAPFNHAGQAWPDHHLYVCLQGSVSLLNHLRFRDYLRAHPEQAQAYGQLKEKLAAECAGDMNRYVAGKTPFILRILQQLGFETASLAAIHSQNASAAHASPWRVD